jgi:DNA-directed RNA polymerase subunit RPC12/RpoP
MSGTGKTIGIIMIVAGIAIGLVAALFFGSGAASGRMPSAMILGFSLVFVVVVLPLVGVGGFLFVKGRQEAAAFAEVEKEKQVLNMVLTQGQVRVAEVALELNATRDQVKNWIYDLVGKGLFTGYINWDEGILYSKQASELRTNKCPNCGGQLELAGKGVVSCPYCGTEIFL